MSDNPYESPKADVDDPYQEKLSQNVDGLIMGQKMVIFAILMNFAANGIMVAAPKLFLVGILVALVALVLSLVGIVKLSHSLGFHVAVSVVVGILMFIPCISLIVLLVLNSRATAKIKEAGYKVGLLGAKT